MNSWNELTLLLYILARMSGCVLINPFFSRQNVPNLVKAGLILMLSLLVFSSAEGGVPVPVGILELGLRIVLELAVGLLLGMVIQFFFAIPQLAGFAIDTQMGLTMNQIYDAGSQSNMSVTGSLLNILMTLLFFAANGHHSLLRIFVTSEELVAYGGMWLGAQQGEYMLLLFGQCALMAVKLAMPILAAELIGQVGMGILMKVIPQINVFVINIDIKVLIGLFLLLILISPISEFLLMAEEQMLDSLREILALSG